MRRVYRSEPYSHHRRDVEQPVPLSFWVETECPLGHSVAYEPFAGDFLEAFGGCDVEVAVDDGRPMPSSKGEYGAAMLWGGALCPDCVRGGSDWPGHFFCSSCSLSSGSPTM